MTRQGCRAPFTAGRHACPPPPGALNSLVVIRTLAPTEACTGIPSAQPQAECHHLISTIFLQTAAACQRVLGSSNTSLLASQDLVFAKENYSLELKNTVLFVCDFLKNHTRIVNNT